jgi:hypothetical protein
MSPVSRDHQLQLLQPVATPVVVPVVERAPLPRRSFLTGRVLDPELHPPLRTRLARAVGRS